MEVKYIESKYFNTNVSLPCGVTLDQIKYAMYECCVYLNELSDFHAEKGWPCLIDFQDSTHFSTTVHNIVVTFMDTWCESLTRNKYNNGYPDLLPKGLYVDETIKDGDDGYEVKASQHGLKASMGHSAKNGNFIVFGFNKSPFYFTEVYSATLCKDDWNYCGRKETSSRCPTACLRKSGKSKMKNNHIYLIPTVKKASKRKVTSYSTNVAVQKSSDS